MNEILKKEILTENTSLFVLRNPYVAEKVLPGQFVILRVREDGERIPLTVADYDREEGTITIVVQEVGFTTGLLCKMGVGDTIMDVAGPLGVPAELPSSGTVVAVGGGVGVAPLLPKCKAMHEAGVKVISIIGARQEDLVILEKEIRENSHEVYICTDDGSCGFKGFVSDKLKELLNEGLSADEVVAIGPVPMMEATSKVTKDFNLKTWVSMNTIMVDGTGMCGACRVTVGGETKFACVDGPMFDGHLVDWKEARNRLDAYKDEEKVANEQCRCFTGGEGQC